MDASPEQCAEIEGRMKAQDLLGQWKETTASFSRNGLPALDAQKLAEKLLCGDLHAECDQVADEAVWGWALNNLAQARAEDGPDLLATAPNLKAVAIVLMARANPAFAEELLKMDLKITRQRMERQNTRRFEDDGSTPLALIAKFRAGRKAMEDAA